MVAPALGPVLLGEAAEQLDARGEDLARTGNNCTADGCRAMAHTLRRGALLALQADNTAEDGHVASYAMAVERCVMLRELMTLEQRDEADRLWPARRQKVRQRMAAATVAPAPALVSRPADLDERLLCAFQALIEAHERVLVESRITKRDARLMQDNLALYTGEAREIMGLVRGDEPAPGPQDQVDVDRPRSA